MKYILKYLDIKRQNISNLFSNGSKKNSTYTHIYTIHMHRKHDKDNGIRCKLFSLGRVYMGVALKLLSVSEIIYQSKML